MSWETFVVGTLEIAPGLPEEKKVTIVDDFEEVLETDLVWDEQNKEYKISHVNWSSHVTEEDIKKCHQKHKRYIKRISFTRQIGHLQLAAWSSARCTTIADFFRSP